MNPELYFLFFCVTVLVVFTIGLAFNAIISGSRFFKTYQFFMGTMSYSKEADTIITRILDKMEAELLVANLAENTIQFFNADDLKEQDTDTPYHRTLRAEAEIFIGAKYYAYGYIHRYFGESKAELLKRRPSFKNFKRIIKLENKLRGESVQNKSPDLKKDKDSAVELQ